MTKLRVVDPQTCCLQELGLSLEKSSQDIFNTLLVTIGAPSSQASEMLASAAVCKSEKWEVGRKASHEYSEVSRGLMPITSFEVEIHHHSVERHCC